MKRKPGLSRRAAKLQKHKRFYIISICPACQARRTQMHVSTWCWPALVSSMCPCTMGPDVCWMFPVLFWDFFLDFLSWNWQLRSPLVLLWFDSFCTSAVNILLTSSASRVGFVRLGLGWVQGWLGLVQGGFQACLGQVWGWLRCMY